ncbi:MAG: hypothetical protein AB7I18_06150 [Candidatus Berkiella sp.]
MRHSWLHCFTKYYQVVKPLLAAIGLLTMNQQALAVHPSLVDLGVNETKAIEFTTGIEYLFILHNENSHSTRFYFGDFAQSVFTRSMQGAAGVSHDSIDVPANGKVLWLFSPGKEGEYTYYAVNGSSDQKGARGKMIVKLAEGTLEQPQPPVQETENTNTEKAQKNKENLATANEKRRWLKGGRRD